MGPSGGKVGEGSPGMQGLLRWRIQLEIPGEQLTPYGQGVGF